MALLRETVARGLVVGSDRWYAPARPMWSVRARSDRHGRTWAAVVSVWMLLVVVVGVAIEVVAPSRAGAASAALPFDMPSQAVLHRSDRKVFAHYFTPYPVSIDNKPAASDYYAVHYLNPAGEGGRHASYGGMLRQRPLPRAVSTSPTWAAEDMRREVATAMAAGIDGFTLNILGLTGVHWDRLLLMLDAAHAVNPSFEIVLMPDASAGVANDVHVLAAKLASVATHPAAYRLADGRLVVSPFNAEKMGAAYWQRLISIMATTYGVAVAFVPVFLDYQSNVAAFAPFSHGMSVWGDRSPAQVRREQRFADDAHARGTIWMQPIAVQDARPRSGIFTEAGNSETLRATWANAIDGAAEWVQLVTWNDYSESTEFAPSTKTTWGPLDISSYYITWFKTGSAPPVVRDTLYLSHRTQPVAARPTGGQTKLMKLTGASIPARDTVEVLSFLRTPGTVTVTVGASVTSYAAPAGVFAATVPLTTGAVSAQVTTGDGTTRVSSPAPVVTNPAVQDLTYHFVSSGRSGTTTSTFGAPATSRLVPVTPCRLADTRDGSGFTRLDANTIRVAAAGRCGIDTTATALAITAVAIEPTAAGYLTVFPAGPIRPETSTLNYRAGQIRSNGAVTPVGAGASFDVFTSSGDVVIDVTGVFVPATSASAGRFVPVAPARLLDSRAGSPLPPGGAVTVPVPAAAAGASALALTVTVTESTAPGFVTVSAAGRPRPSASSLYIDAAGQTRAGTGIFPVSAEGVSVFLSGGGHVVVDVTGWFTGASAPSAATGLFVPVSPDRLLDTRSGGSARVTSAEIAGFDQRATSVLVNVTGTDGERSFVTVYPSRTPRPSTSTLNPEGGGDVVANMAIVGVGDPGIDLFSSASSHLVVDATGWFT